MRLCDAKSDDFYVALAGSGLYGPPQTVCHYCLFQRSRYRYFVMKKKKVIKAALLIFAVLFLFQIVNTVLYLRSEMSYEVSSTQKWDKKTFSEIAECVIDEFDKLIDDNPEVLSANFDFYGNIMSVSAINENFEVIARYQIECSKNYGEIFSKVLDTFHREQTGAGINTVVTRHQVRFSGRNYAIIYVRGLGIPQKYREDWNGFYFRPKGFSIKWFECCKWRE